MARPRSLPLRPRNPRAFRQSVAVGVAYLLAVQVAFLLMPFTSETLWLWALGAAEAFQYGRGLSFLADPEWWLALAFPSSVLTLGTLGAYSALTTDDPVPAVVAGAFLAGLFGTEVFLRTEYAILYVILAPVAAVASVAAHLLVPRLRRATAR